MTMTLSGARVVDPVLTTHVQGYQHAERIGNLLFPRVDVFLGAGKVIEFGKESFLLYNARRAPGASTKRIEFGYEGKSYSLVQDSLESKVPREFARDASGAAGIDLGMRGTNLVMNSLTLNLEYEQAQLATDASKYDADHQVSLAGASQWSNVASNPIIDVQAAREAIRASCGMYPNVMVCGPKPYGALKTNEAISEKFRNTDLVTAEMLAKLFEVDRVAEGKAVYASDDGTFNDVWGNSVILAYAPQAATGFEQPSYGYTYTMSGHPFVEPPYYDNNQKSDIYGVTYERAPQLTGMIAGFILLDVAAE